jgi:hypothetical protein
VKIKTKGMIPIAHIEDRWLRPGPDGRKIRTPRHGTGLRWRVRYLDQGGAERSRSFDTKAAAEAFRDTTAADVRRGTWLDPDAGKITLRKYAEGWLSMQSVQESTREAVEMRLRRHVYPALGRAVPWASSPAAHHWYRAGRRAWASRPPTGGWCSPRWRRC